MMRARNEIKSLIFLTVLTLVTTCSFGAIRRGLDPTTTPETSVEMRKRELLKQDSVVQKAKTDFNVYADYVYREIGEKDLSYEAFKRGLTGYHNLEKRGELARLDTLTIIDFTRPSNLPRLFIIDLCNRTVIHKSLVAHGVKSGSLYPKRFSNEENSHQSSLGFYVTTTTYSGKYDIMLRLKGMEHSNSHAGSRGVVMHGADYASYEFLEKNGCQLGRSYGCPSVPFEKFDQVVEWIKGGSCMFIYYPSRSYLRYSKYLHRKNYLEDFVEV